MKLESVATFKPRDQAERLSKIAGIVAFAIGCCVLAGWVTGTEFLKSIAPRFIVMLPLTAIGFVLAGASLYLGHGHTSGRQRVARTLALLVTGLGISSTIERVFGLDFGFDHFLFYQSLLTYPYRPLGLMAVNSAISFVLAGAALILMASRRPYFRQTARRLAMAGLAIASVALIGHIYSAPRMFTFDREAAMALLAAIAFAILHSGIVLVRPDEGGVALLTGNDMTGSLVRKALPSIIILPVVLGFLWIAGTQAMLFSRETGVALFVTLMVGGLAVLLWSSARELRAGDREREVLLQRERDARQRADIANKAKNDFLAVVSHELRTPLNAIIGYQGLMSDAIAGPITPEQTLFLDRIRRSADHLSEVVGQILTLSQMDDGAVQPVFGKFTLDRALDDVQAIIAPLAAAKGLGFSIHRDGETELWSDRGKLVQILVNLAGNAVKFTSAGEVAIEVFPDDTLLRIDVRDTGIGILPENQERVFDEFWQVEAPTTRQHGGTGLGLAVSQRLARLLGGEISLVSTSGVGSTFSLVMERNQGQ